MKKSLQLHIMLFAVSCVFVLLYSLSGSPLYLNSGEDNNTFSIIGLGIVQGKLPYVDLFDHKGPLLFYIFALAKWISYSRIGIYIVLVCFLYFSLYLQYSINRIYLNERKAIYSLLIPLIYLAITMDEGTQCEFFELPFIIFSLYLCLKILKGISMRIKWSCFCIGASSGCVFLIRINDIFIIGILYLMLLIYLLKERNYNAVKISIIYFVIGLIASIAPFAIYFWCIGILDEVWYGSFVFNIIYISVMGDFFGFPFLKLIILTFLTLCTLPIFTEKKHRLEMGYIILPILIASVVGIGNNPFTHYYMILMPLVGLICAINGSKLIKAIMLWVFGVSGWNVVLGHNKFAPLQGSLIYVTYQRYKDFRERAHVSEEYSKFVLLIKDKVPVQDLNNIWNYNLVYCLEIYSVNNITPKNAYFVPTHRSISHFHEIEDIKRVNPEWLLIDCSPDCPMKASKIDSIYISDHYEAIDSLRGEVKIKLMKKRRNRILCRYISLEY